MAVLSQVSTKAAVVFYVLQMSLLIATLLQPQCCSNSERAGSSDNQGHCLLLHFCKTQTKDIPLEVINGSCDTCSHTVTTFGSIGLTKHHPRRHLHTRTPSCALPPTPTPSKTDPFNPPGNLLPPFSFLLLTLCGLSCMLTVPKRDEPSSPMGISPPSLLASATSVSV